MMRKIALGASLIVCACATQRMPGPGSGSGSDCTGTSCATPGAIMLGGRSGITDTTPLTDIWSWDGTAWKSVDIAFPPGSPQCLGLENNALFTYAAVPETPPGPVAFLRYYTLGGATWSQLPAAPTAIDAFSDGTGATTSICSGTTMPPVSPDAVMARLGDTTVMVGGSPSQTWTWDGSAWTQLQVAGPTPRSYASFTALGDQLVLFGGEISDGNLRNDTWTWDGATWTQVATTGPSPRMSGAMTEVAGALVLFGGWDPNNNTLDDTWTFDGASWTQQAVSGGPSQRAEALMVSSPTAASIQ
jgi:hypothetical protein